ncbi:MAG: peptidoglycan-binding domain-containing protein, partial [Patescibacteria group bacterium]
MLKKIALASLGILLLTSPVLASADQISDLQAQVQALLAQIKSLQSVPTNNDDEQSDTRGNKCPTLSSTLTVGSTDALTGGQVSQLQAFLTEHFSVEDDIITGYFGVKTARYVKQFQAQQRIEQVGWVGKRTRAAIAKFCVHDVGGDSNTSGTIISFTGSYGSTPLNLPVQFFANGIPESQIQYYKNLAVDFGDGAFDEMKVERDQIPISMFPDPNHPIVTPVSSTYHGYVTHKYVARGTYTARLTIKGAEPAPILGTLQVTIADALPPSLDFAESPYGGGRLWWASTSADSCVSVGSYIAGIIGTKGEVMVSPTKDSVYTITCTGMGGSVSKSVTVNVGGGSIQLPVITSTSANGAGNWEVRAGGEMSIYGSNF